VTETTAATEGPDWSSRAAAWVEHWARLAEPARRAVAEATGIGPGTRVLDVGCGSGELCALAAERGAVVAGIDAAEGMVAIARRRLPGADLRVGPMETLPWDDGAFDVVTAFNAFQFAASFEGAAAEAARVTRPGGLVAVCNWGALADRDLATVYAALGAAAGEPRPLEDRVGLDVVAAADVDVPYEVPDLATLQRALVDGAGFEATPEAIEDAAAPFCRPDGSYRFENRFRYVIARAPSGSASSSKSTATQSFSASQKNRTESGS
jgi:SAM-dependent methyltransferase